MYVIDVDDSVPRRVSIPDATRDSFQVCAHVSVWRLEDLATVLSWGLGRLQLRHKIQLHLRALVG